MELTISLPAGDQRLAMVGAAERNLKMLREGLGVKITERGGTLRISGEEVAVGRAARVIEQLSAAARRRQPMEPREVMYTIADVAGETDTAVAGDADPAWDQDQGLDVYLRGRRVRPATPGQRDYLDAIRQHDLTFCTGPAGTGKTYLAVAAAAWMLKRGIVRKMVLVRPAVEAGERLGFLPGDMQQKVHPYLRPLLDALHDMMDFAQVTRLMQSDVIEIVPLAFMRGRTLNDAVIILDEAQNATRGQMLMFLTRLGQQSKMIVTGDTSQVDLDDPTESGLVDAARLLRRVGGIAFVALGREDIVRHSLVQRIVEAYGREKDAAEPADNRMAIADTVLPSNR